MTLLAKGPGEPLGVGGRYDHLLERFGAAAPATGFAFDVDNVMWALTTAGITAGEGLPIRAVIGGGTDARRRNEAGLWRELGVRVSVLALRRADAARRYARAWSCDVLVWLERGGARVTRLQDGRTRRLSEPPDVELLSWVRDGSAS